MDTPCVSVCRDAYEELVCAHHKARTAVPSGRSQDIDMAFACVEHMLRSAFHSESTNVIVPCLGGRDYLVPPDAVEAMLAGVWAVCRKLLDAATVNDGACRLLLARASAHLMRDVLEPQFRAHPQLRSRYGV
jgi:hypothetical protein